MCIRDSYNTYTHITRWMIYTPEFQLAIVLVSSPLALLVALWGMTTKATLQLMSSSASSSPDNLLLTRNPVPKCTAQIQ